MDSVFTLVDQLNTWGPALAVLHRKGYRTYDISTNDPVRIEWVANKKSRRFYAPSPVALLGLISLCEERGEDWAGIDQDLQIRLYRQARRVGKRWRERLEQEDQRAQRED